ncbi:hypothetical protein P4H61_10140 [Paenibacillus peoriae]|uniref:hypothetical protein n=1 Tax=Paenibacillus peoriae TaxID=59893 RepID=UPI0003084417|nr:hypothetical protein [Paenibacillus peoriae]MEC0181861.1 hypothetical protein [Paenibacillus peoriae]
MGKIIGYGWGEALRVGFDLTIAVAAGFFRLDSYRENPAAVYASEASFLTESF